MPIQKAFRFLLGLLILFGLNELQAHQETTNLRGQIVTYNAYVGEYVPVPGVRVAILYYDSRYRKWRELVSTYTNTYGMYYFYNIRPGNYYLYVNDQYYYTLTVRKLRPGEQFQDIPRIVI